MEIKYRLTSYVDKPRFNDRRAPDGIFHYGFRKVRSDGKFGYVLAQGLKFGCRELLEHVGQWVYIVIDDYWSNKAVVGRDFFSNEIDVLGWIECKSI